MSGLVLVVDDEELVRNVVREKLEGCGYTVVEAEDGKEALRILAEQSIDIVVTDLIMPEKDGLEMVMGVRQRWPSIPVIVISAPSNRLFLDTARRLGAGRVFEKPLNLEQLAAAIEDLRPTPA